MGSSGLEPHEPQLEEEEGAVINPFHNHTMDDNNNDINNSVRGYTTIEPSAPRAINRNAFPIKPNATARVPVKMAGSSVLNSMDFEEVESRQWRKVFCVTFPLIMLF